MKNYLKTIKYFQEILIFISILIFLILLPPIMVFTPNIFSNGLIKFLFAVSLAAVSLVMIIRPLADIFSRNKWIRPLVILRKSFGILSASIIVSFILQKFITSQDFFLQFIKPEYWSLEKYALFAHLGDITALILLITSNNFSKKILKKNWKRVQKLAYLYFYSGAMYVFLSYGDIFAAISMVVVTILVIIAFFKNKIKNKKYENN